MLFSRALLLILVTVALYCPMLSSWFKTMDDQFSIVSNQSIQDSSKWPQLFKEGYFRDHSYYRPLTNVSYALEFKAFGLNPFYYNVDNVVIHIANAFLVWLLIGAIMNFEIGFWVALVFAIHPVQWEAVANISGRAILLSAFFSLLTFIFFVQKRMIPSLLCFALGLLCKESTAITPGLILAYAFLFKRRMGPIFWYIPFICGYVYLRHHLGINEFFAWRNAHEAILGFVTFLRSVIMYFRLWLLPIDLHFDRSLQLFASVTQTGAVLTMIFWGIASGALLACRKALAPIHWLALIWFALTLLPISQIVTTIGVQPGYISCAEHFLYVTSIPVFMIIVMHIYKNTSFIVRAGLLGVLFFFAATTFEQNIYARSELAMMTRSLSYQPHNARLNSSVGLIHAINGRFNQAEQHFRMAVIDDAENPRYTISLGKSVCDQKRYIECLQIYNSIRTPGMYANMLNDNKRAVENLMKAK